MCIMLTRDTGVRAMINAHIQQSTRQVVAKRIGDVLYPRMVIKKNAKAGDLKA